MLSYRGSIHPPTPAIPEHVRHHVHDEYVCAIEEFDRLMGIVKLVWAPCDLCHLVHSGTCRSFVATKAPASYSQMFRRVRGFRSPVPTEASSS